MNNSLLAPLILGGVVVVAVGAYAGTRSGISPWQDYAEVVSVAPAFDNDQTARQECNDESVTQQVPIKDEKRIAGTAIGAVVGGCRTVYDNNVNPAGFDVTYMLDGKQGVVRMDHEPGKRIRVENGELDLTRT